LKNQSGSGNYSWQLILFNEIPYARFARNMFVRESSMSHGYDGLTLGVTATGLLH